MNKIFIFLMISVAIRVVTSSILPLFTDEAYYLSWSKFLSLGYMDHPPAVAWISFGHYFLDSALGVRLFNIFISAIGIFGFFKLSEQMQIRSLDQRLKSATLLFFSLAGLAYGTLNTPDIVFLTAWIYALLFTEKALKGRPQNWIYAGIFTGMGLWSKYLMLFIGPVFLWGIIRQDFKKGLFKPWPYVGLIFCLLTISPHLYWNHQNDWISFKFQMGHGFADNYAASHSSKSTIEKGQHIPIDIASEDILYEPFDCSRWSETDKIEEDDKLKSIPWWKTYIKEALRPFRYASEYLGGQFALMGAFSLLLLLALIKSLFQRRLKIKLKEMKRAFLNFDSPLCKAAVIFPFGFFFILSFMTKVEANWPVAYLVGFCILIAKLIPRLSSTVYLAAAGNVLLVFAVSIHANQPFLPIKPSKDRILKETAHFKPIAELLIEQSQPIAVKTYQLAAQLKWYEPDLKLFHWPGLARGSEYQRRTIYQTFSKTACTLMYLSDDAVAPSLPGYFATKLQVIERPHKTTNKIKLHDRFDKNICTHPPKIDYLYLSQHTYIGENCE